jgi:uncharacterized protein YraI
MKRALLLSLVLLLAACGGSPATPTLDLNSRDATSIARQVATIEARNVSATRTAVASSQNGSSAKAAIAAALQPSATPLVTPTIAIPAPLASLIAGYEEINIRSGPGTDYDILGELLPGVNARITGKNDDGSWWQIDYNDAAGWVSAPLVNVQGDTAMVQTQQVAPAPTGAPDPQPYVLVKSEYDYVNVRSGPARTYDVIGRLQPNTAAHVIGKSADGSWWQIDFEGASRWIDGGFVDLHGEAASVTVADAPTQPAALAQSAASVAQAAVQEAGPTATPAAVAPSSDGCPTTSSNSYGLLPRDGPASDRPDREHGDLNLGLRGYGVTDAPASLVDYNGASDGNAPQFSGMFQPNRMATIQSTYRVNLWVFESDKCNGAPNGCRGSAITDWPVTMIGLATNPGESISIPSRAPEIGPGYQALVLYADTTRITLNYTRQDNISYGYVVYIENVCVDPNLLALYRAQNDANGWRSSTSLPALRNGQPLGTAAGGEVRVAIRDTATFLDPRSRKDWWQR